MASKAPLRLVELPQAALSRRTLSRNADRRQVITYESGHVWRVNRAHVERVLDAKAAAMDAGDHTRHHFDAEGRR